MDFEGFQAKVGLQLKCCLTLLANAMLFVSAPLAFVVFVPMVKGLEKIMRKYSGTAPFLTQLTQRGGRVACIGASSAVVSVACVLAPWASVLPSSLSSHEQEVRLSVSALFLVYGSLLICEGCYVASYRAEEKGEAGAALLVRTTSLMKHADKVLIEDKAAMMFLKLVMKPFNVIHCSMDASRWVAVSKWLYPMFASLVSLSAVLCWDSRHRAAWTCDLINTTQTSTANITNISNATNTTCDIYSLVQETAYCCRVVPVSFLGLVQAGSSTSLALWAAVKVASSFVLVAERKRHRFGSFTADVVRDVSEIEGDLKIMKEQLARLSTLHCME